MYVLLANNVFQNWNCVTGEAQNCIIYPRFTRSYLSKFLLISLCKSKSSDSTWVHPHFSMGFVWLLCNILQISVFPFVLFIWAIVLSILRRIKASDYPFSIFKLFIVITDHLHGLVVARAPLGLSITFI